MIYNQVVRLPSRKSTTDGLKERLSHWLQQGSKKASDVIKTKADDALDKLQSQARKASHQASVQAQNVYQQGSSQAVEAYQRSSSVASEALQKGKASAKDLLQSSSKVVSEQLQTAASQTTQAITQTSKVAAEATTQRLRNTSLGMMTRAQEIGQKALRWFFWWSLAAIAVYGFATSIPTALVKYSMSGKKSASTDESTASNHPLSDTAAGPNDTERGWIYSLLPGSTSVQESTTERHESPSRGFWPSTWGSTSSKD